MSPKTSFPKTASAQALGLNADLHQVIRYLLLAARAQVRQTVNTTMVQTYWHTLCRFG